MVIKLKQTCRHTFVIVMNQMIWKEFLVPEIYCSLLEPIYSYCNWHEIIYNMYFFFIWNTEINSQYLSEKIKHRLFLRWNYSTCVSQWNIAMSGHFNWMLFIGCIASQIDTLSCVGQIWISLREDELTTVCSDSKCLYLDSILTIMCVLLFVDISYLEIVTT